ncbi:MAG: phage terminase small subunit P27 family [Candidatus Obscuribacterales bacterium]|nr:phage terminase small subunit P27 family [Candidatus Obscuribacterales bacterium]
MGRRGPAPKPTALKEAEGNPGKRPLNKREPKPDLALPKCPDFLSDLAKKEWDRVVGQLFRNRLMTDLDAMNLAGMCQALKRAVAADKILEKSGYTMTTMQGNEIQRPEVSISRNSWAEYRKFAVEFGMSPASRSRIQIDNNSGADEEDAADEEEFFS